MDEEQKKRIAVFRFGAIANLVGGIVLDRGDRERLNPGTSATTNGRYLFSERSRLSRTTLRRWIQQYDGRLGIVISPRPGRYLGRAGPWNKRSPKP